LNNVSKLSVIAALVAGSFVPGDADAIVVDFYCL
jgi:hypothetical protein